MKHWLWMSGALISSCITQCAMADGSDINTGVDGQDLQLVFDLQDNLGARFNFNFIDYRSAATLSRDETDLNHEPKFNLNAMNALLDWHPVASDFFVSGGAMANRNKSPGMAQTYFNQNYSGQQNALKGVSAYSTVGMSDAIDNVTVAPYLGLGWKTRQVKKRGWGFSSDIGVLYHGRSTVSLDNASCLIANSGAVGVCQNADNGAAGGTMIDLRTGGMNYVPVLRAGVSYVF